MMLQGTSLPSQVAEELDDMFEHKVLGSATDDIKCQHQQLSRWQQRLQTGQQGEEVRLSVLQTERQLREVVHRQVLLVTL